MKGDRNPSWGADEKGNLDGDVVGVVIVDHGSRRGESNDMLLEVAASFQRHSGYQIVEPAHMELASPSIQEAVDRCVARGARDIILFPYFLSPGRHWHDDIPRLARNATGSHPGVRVIVTAPLGLHPLMLEIIQQRIQQCVSHVHGSGPPCELCDGNAIGCRAT
ncbi:MAG: CbiX/SirB N-terminal domain-containing protein [Pirellulaceae bacterium]